MTGSPLVLLILPIRKGLLGMRIPAEKTLALNKLGNMKARP